MTISRREAMLGFLALAGCGAAPTVSDDVTRAVPNPAFDAWVAGFRARAAARGVSESVLGPALRGAGYLPGVVERDRNQTEFARPLEDYLSIAASDERIALGRQMLARHGALLAEIEARHGVEARVVAAIWGVESFYGTRRGEVPVISALATLAYDGRRGAFFEGQMMAALRILQNGDITPARMTGSWAGAMGHTQFIPTSYLEFAVDFRGDGRRDIWSDDPTDALASTAAYLARSGWQRGQPWGLEVRLPQGIAPATRSVSEWSGMGVQVADGRALPDAGTGMLLMPHGAAGPAFLVFANFRAILRYNNAQNYGLGVGHLSDRIAGAGPLRAAFPPDANGLTKADRQEMQRLLAARGHDPGGSDGVIGPNTRAAIAAYQRRKGMAATGEPSQALLALLRQG